MRKRILWIAPLAMLAMVVFIFVGGQLVRLLWNWLLPPLFGWPQITFWQALGLLILCRILFGGWTGGGRGYGMRGRMRERMRERMAERWEHMTPEEREKCRERMRDRWGFDPSSGRSVDESTEKQP